MQGIKVLSYNVWGVPVAKDLAPRMAALGPRLLEYDIICLQEQFTEEDFDTIVKAIPQPNAFHTRRFPSSFVGSGLTIMSKFEITSAHFELFPAQGRPEMILQGDYMAQKGVALARMRLRVDHNSNHVSPAAPLRQVADGAMLDDQSGTVDLLVYNTHLIAQYEKYSEIGGYAQEGNAAARLSQALHMAKFIVHTARPKDFIVVCGDFNAGADSPELKLLLAVCHSHGINLHRSVINDNKTNHTFTEDNAYNSSQAGFLRYFAMEEDRPVQLDHILVSTRTMLLLPYGISPSISPKCVHLAEHEPVGVVAMTSNDAVDVDDGKRRVPLSDHFGVAARMVPFHPMKPPFFISRDAIEPTLLDDYSRSGETVSFAAKILQRGADMCSTSAKKWLATSVLCVLTPIVTWIANGYTIKIGNSSVDVPQWPHHPLCVILFGFWAGISFIIGFLNRRNDAVVYRHQVGQLRRLLAE